MHKDFNSFHSIFGIGKRNHNEVVKGEGAIVHGCSNSQLSKESLKGTGKGISHCKGLGISLGNGPSGHALSNTSAEIVGTHDE